MTADPNQIVLNHLFDAIMTGQNTGEALQKAAKEIKELRRVDGAVGGGESSDSAAANSDVYGESETDSNPDVYGESETDSNSDVYGEGDTDA